jgi:hypothetical protein
VLHERVAWWHRQTRLVTLVIVQGACSLTEWCKFSRGLHDTPVSSALDPLAILFAFAAYAAETE